MADIVDDESTNIAPVVDRSDNTHAFLAASDPNLGLDFLSVDVHVLGLELDTNGGLGSAC